jgi:hypothetical protein
LTEENSVRDVFYPDGGKTRQKKRSGGERPGQRKPPEKEIPSAYKKSVKEGAEA